ncbi:acyltransferase family protein [Streptomyces sp. NBC_01768]|uniref:acyltransferase family protein n=1 Tax=Streptomyces sp. NBC_01768 TaxID=2975938 RepID=UPI002DD7DA07|nr:acyltransferase [Streptomyces sp. NBC_01768]WSC32909.1 acyltransferase [Streptomyces sp. NBC_01768]
MERNRCADLLRVCAIGGVVLGHWLLASVTYRSGHLSGLDALQYVGWGRWLTLLLQVMPVFFVVGGYANAVSWTAHQQRGEGWTNWVRGRMLRLLWPTTVYVVVGEVVVTVARIADADKAALARAGWLATLHLWFLPVYLLLIALTPLLLAAHRQWGLAVPAVMAVAAVGVDALVLGPHLPLIGFANYLLVWGVMHQWGFAWQDGTLTRPRWRCGVLVAGGAVLLTALVVWGPFPIDMIGTGARVGNTTPPSIALLAFAATQTGLLLVVDPAVERLLARPWRWRLVSRLNRTVMTVYLWHMMPVIIVAVMLYPTGFMPQPTIGSAQWWALRPAWLTLLTALLVLLTVGVMRAQRPLRLLPSGLGTAGWWSPLLVLCALGAIVPALARLAICGFAPGGHVPVLLLATYVCGLLAALYSGRPSAGRSG